MLEFLGSGSAFNTSLDNNCAFIRNESTLVLIDCGSTIFKKIEKHDLLNEVKNVYVIITHTHPDHVASLGDLIFYCYYMMKTKVTVVFPNKAHLGSLLDLMGIKEDVFNFVEIKDTMSINNDDIKLLLTPCSTKHSNSFDCFGYILDFNNKAIYYSGDANSIPKNIFEKFTQGQINEIYQDTSKGDFQGNPHMSLRKLCECIPDKLRNRVYCMHLDKGFDESEAKELGFNVVHNKY